MFRKNLNRLERQKYFLQIKYSYPTLLNVLLTFISQYYWCNKIIIDRDHFYKENVWWIYLYRIWMIFLWTGYCRVRTTAGSRIFFFKIVNNGSSIRKLIWGKHLLHSSRHHTSLNKSILALCWIGQSTC